MAINFGTHTGSIPLGQYYIRIGIDKMIGIAKLERDEFLRLHRTYITRLVETSLTVLLWTISSDDPLYYGIDFQFCPIFHWVLADDRGA